jgi:hypothetical protein
MQLALTSAVPSCLTVITLPFVITNRFISYASATETLTLRRIGHVLSQFRVIYSADAETAIGEVAVCRYQLGARLESSSQ